MHNEEILHKALSYSLTRDQLMTEDQLRMKEEGLYSDDIGGIVNLYGLIGLFQIMHYCHLHNLKPVYISADTRTNDGGEVIFVNQTL